VRRGWLAWVGLALVPAFAGIALALDIASDGDVFAVLALMIIGLPFAIVGALVASRQPGQRIGWLMLTVGVTLALGVACDATVSYLLAHSDAPFSPGWPAGISGVCFRIFFLSIVSTLLLIPTGTLPSRRWRPVGAAVIVLALLSVVLMFLPGVFSDWDKEGVRNPVGIESLGTVLRPLDSIATGLTMLLLLVSAASVAVRFRGARGTERAQLRWIAAAVVTTGLTWVLMIVGSLLLGSGRVADTLWVVALASIGLIAVGIGFAVLRYRLYDIDRVISKALVYGSLTVLLALAYVGLVLAGQAIFSSFAGGSNLAIAVSTLVVAALFLPLRTRVQRVVDRRFYRHRYDAQRTLEAFGARLREQVDLDELAAELRGVVAETMQPTHASLWLREQAR